jgi:hypothetical protein
MSNSDRPLRGCEICGGVDDHPRAIHVTPPDHPLSQLQDGFVDKFVDEGVSGLWIKHHLETTSMYVHHDCCAERGCPLESDAEDNCANVVKRHKSATGNALLKSITGGK